jgi:hypothetical protein
MLDALVALLEGLLGDDEVATACSACLALGGVLAASAPKSKRCARRFTRLFSSLTLMVANVSKHTDEPQRAVAAAAAFALGVALRGAVSNGERARSVGPLLDAAVSLLKGAAATRGAGTRLASCATLALGLLCEGIASAPVSTSESLGLLAQVAEGLCSAAAECVLSGTDATQFASAASIVVASINNAGAGEEAARVVERLRVLSLSIDMRALAAADLDADLIGVAASTAQVFAAAAPAMDGMDEPSAMTSLRSSRSKRLFSAISSAVFSFFVSSSSDVFTSLSAPPFDAVDVAAVAAVAAVGVGVVEIGRAHV